MCRKLKKGFTIVEILIAVFLIAALLLMGIPSYLKARKEARKRTCIANLWSLDEAVKQWVLENDILEGTSITGNETEIHTYLRHGKPTCPSGGTYSFGTVGTDPQVQCSKEVDLGHKLP